MVAGVSKRKASNRAAAGKGKPSRPSSRLSPHNPALKSHSAQPKRGHRQADLSWHSEFIQQLKKDPSVVDACIAIGIRRRLAYEHRDAYPDFAEAWDDALAIYRARIKRELIRRAVEGVEVPIIQNGEQVGSFRRYSDGLLLALNKAENKEFRDRMEHTGAGGGPILHSTLTPEDLAAYQERIRQSLEGKP